MAAVCRTHDIPFLHVLQPTLHDAGAKPRTAEEIEKGAMGPAWQAAVERGYPLLRAAGEELAREGVPFVDATRVFADVETTLYFDACHFGPEGNRILGRWIAARFLERLPR
jgi:lysophospholipase L1-like esterase